MHRLLAVVIEGRHVVGAGNKKSLAVIDGEKSIRGRTRKLMAACKHLRDNRSDRDQNDAPKDAGDQLLMLTEPLPDANVHARHTFLNERTSLRAKITITIDINL